VRITQGFDKEATMRTDPILVKELRTDFKTGATPSALVRVIAERHSGEPELDRLVREYFREAFFVPALRIGPNEVARIVEGTAAPALNTVALYQMVARRSEWDKPAPGDDPASWLNRVMYTDEAEMVRNTKVEAPELLAVWDRIDETARRFITRVIANANSLSERVDVLAALAEQLQQQVLALQNVEAQNPRSLGRLGGEARKNGEKEGPTRVYDAILRTVCEALPVVPTRVQRQRGRDRPSGDG
jgi:hypothetical protein